jgi:hypothetical protein
MDWNWFFSSLAQSVAALVGVLGAFLVASLLNKQTNHADERARTRELLRGSERLTDAAKTRFFEWYNKRTLKYALDEVEDYLEKTEEPESAEDLYDRFVFPEYLPKERSLQVIRNKLEKRQQEIDLEAARQKGLAPPDFRSGVTQRDLERLRKTSDIRAEREDYEREREAIEQLIVEVKAHLRAIQEHLDRIQPQPEASHVVRKVLLGILLLFWAGVIYPLSFLPVPLKGLPPLSLTAFCQILFSLQGLLLALAAVVFTGMIGWLWQSHERLRHPAAAIAELENRLRPGSYSEFLQVRVENGIPL